MGRFTGLLMLVLLSPLVLSGQAIQTEFGKNRIQYTDDFDKWDLYETANFVTHWYGKGRQIAHTVVQFAELDNAAVQRVLEHKMNDKIELIVYVDLTDLKQTNLGIQEQFISQQGVTTVIDNKVFVYFDGDHNTLRRSLREGIAQVYIQSMLHGSNLQEVVQNAVLLNLPDWFQAGLVSYIGEEWNPALETQLKDYFTKPEKRRKDFARLARLDPQLAGHSMWYYIARTYGRTSISNILYLTRINRSLENGLLYVLGIDSKTLGAQWENYFRSRFFDGSPTLSDLRHDLPLVNPRRYYLPARVRYSPDGHRIAYTVNDHGRSRLFVYDLRTGKKQALLRFGIRNFEQQADLNYPAFAWSPDGRYLAVLSERRDVIYLTRYDTETGGSFREPLSPEYQRVYSMDYWSSDTLLLNGTTEGYGDLYLYDPVTRQSVRMTEDFYDDLDASVIHLDGRRQVLFSSNRPNETLRKMRLDSLLPVGPFDLFLLDWTDGRGSLRQLTFTGGLNERDPRLAGEDVLVCRADVGGRWQRMEVSRLSEDPPVMTLLTAYDRDLLVQEFIPTARGVIEVFDRHGKPVVQLSPYPPGNTGMAPGEQVLPLEPILPLPEEAESQPAPDTAHMEPGYRFQTPFARPDNWQPAPEPVRETAPVIEPTPAPIEAIAGQDTTQVPVDWQGFGRPAGLGYDPSNLVPFLSPRIVASRLRYRVDQFNLTMDNSLLFGGLDTYAGERREFQPQPLGILVKATLKDLLEDYIVTGGARYPTRFNGSEYFLVFDNRKRRIDKQYAIYRKSITEGDPTGRDPYIRNQFVSVLGTARFSYPFDTYNSIRVSGTLRNDRVIALSTEINSLRRKTDDTQRIGLRAEWIYDNARLLDINIRTGTRLKTWVEVVKRFDLNLFEEGKKFQFNKGFMTVLGIDARHYVSPDQRTVFAARFTAATSIGSERILYYLGGVENWLFSQYDQGSAVPSDINFAYTTLAANMRGFKYNARNGSSVALVNTEVRVPILQYVSRQKIRSSFLRNTQLVGFVDVGTAWHGRDPFSPDNPLNTVVLMNPPTVEVTVNYYRNPLVVGYGAGVRTLLFGYILKLDYAWGLETKSSNKPILHFSMGADF